MEIDLWSNIKSPYRCFKQPTVPLLMAHIHTDEDFPVLKDIRPSFEGIEIVYCNVSAIMKSTLKIFFMSMLRHK